FRQTEAEFRQFRVGKELPAAGLSADVVARIRQIATELPAVGNVSGDLAEKLSTDDALAAVTALRDRAKQMEQQATQLRKLAQSVHQRRVQRELVKVLDGDDAAVDLFHAALLVAVLDNDEVDAESYRKELDRVARDVAKSIPENADGPAKLAALNKYLFEEQGF